MAQMTSTQHEPKLDRFGVKRLIQVLVSQFLIAGLLFLSAGRLDWWAAWAYLGVSLAGVLYLALAVGRKHPEVINERGGKHENQKQWDKVVSAIYATLGLVTYVVAGLDAGRFGWSSMALGWQIVGLAGLVVEFGLVGWVMASNPYLSTVVRIQDDRGHQVVTTGPYRYVRHPMYAGLVVLWLATPLFLGSWWALLPGALAGVALVVRTVLEDRTLQAELPGYAEYARQVRYRLAPGLW